MCSVAMAILCTVMIHYHETNEECYARTLDFGYEVVCPLEKLKRTCSKPNGKLVCTIEEI